jgi:hypothetical protein
MPSLGDLPSISFGAAPAMPTTAPAVAAPPRTPVVLDLDLDALTADAAHVTTAAAEQPTAPASGASPTASQAPDSSVSEAAAEFFRSRGITAADAKPVRQARSIRLVPIVLGIAVLAIAALVVLVVL